LLRAAPSARRQSRIIRSNRFRSNENCVRLSAELVRITTRRGIRDPTRFARPARQSAVEAHSAFCDHKGLSANDPFVKSFIKAGAVIG
jgi:hypothetical protein